ncbi:MAG: polysaccharide biosynthesis/export family protein, partial [Candidatus Hydrogenedentes bacterium]|nr:polysaccharide biosynthesis/export family protein [Candidatus Hydrogenedentota bacterium]
MARFHMSRWILALTAIAVAVPALAQNSTAPIAAGEFVYVDVYRRPELTTTMQVDPDGNISLPYVGKVNVLGKTEREAAVVVSAALRRILKNPQVTVSRSSGLFMGGARTAEMTTEIVPLHNANAENLSNALQGMTSQGGSISYDPDTNTLL